jgi:hypothetical protein
MEEATLDELEQADAAEEACKTADEALDLALSITDALDHKISASFNTALSPVVNAISEMSQRIGQVNQDALRTMIDDFRSAVQGGAAEHAAALGQTFGDVERTLGSALRKRS